MPLAPDFLTQFRAEVKKSLLLEEADKQYWLDNAEKLPTSMVESFFEQLKVKNELMDSYIFTAIGADPDLVDKLKQQVKSLQRNILKLKEKDYGDQGNVEKIMEEELKNA